MLFTYSVILAHLLTQDIFFISVAIYLLRILPFSLNCSNYETRRLRLIFYRKHIKPLIIVTNARGLGANAPDTLANLESEI
jgi:hypothetical protein